MSEKIRTATVRDIDNYLSDDAEVCAWEDVKNVLDAKNKEIAELNDKLQNVSSLLKETREWLLESQKLHKKCADNAVKVIRHHKYRRCLAMARWCKDNADWWNYEQINRLHEQRGNAESFRFKEAHNRFCFFAKWNERWLELADKFKEVKETLELVENANTLCKEIK